MNGAAARTVGADGARRRAVADEVQARLSDYAGAAPFDAATGLADAQRRQVVDGRAEPGRPQDDVRARLGAVGPHHAGRDDPFEHLLDAQRTPRARPGPSAGRPALGGPPAAAASPRWCPPRRWRSRSAAGSPTFPRRPPRP